MGGRAKRLALFTPTQPTPLLLHPTACLEQHFIARVSPSSDKRINPALNSSGVKTPQNKTQNDP